MIDHIIEVLRNNCFEVSSNTPYCKSETLNLIECGMNIQESERETINNAKNECSQQYLKCQDEKSVCQTQRDECDAIADPCWKFEVAAATCTQTHKEEVDAYNAGQKSKKEIILEEINNFGK